MKRRIKPAFLFVVHLLFLKSISAQDQDSLLSSLSRKFSDYCRSVPWEEIYIQSDREDYISGEVLWFNAYVVDRQSFKPSENSKILYFELLNTENRPVIQKRILINKGFGPGQVVLPDTLSSGVYTIRAYTSWMKNFLPLNCFVKGINIYNTLNLTAFKKIIPSEPGSNKVIEKLHKAEFNNTAATIKTDNSRKDSLNIFFITGPEFRRRNNRWFCIISQSHGNINYAATRKVVNDTTMIAISKLMLGQGIDQITIFDSEGKPVCERFIYTPVIKKNSLIVNSPDSCGLRQKIDIDIRTDRLELSEPEKSNISISVVPLTAETDFPDLESYLVSGTEFSPELQKILSDRRIEKMPQEAIDSLLLNVKSNWINWNEILADGTQNFRFRFEKEDNFLSGRLLSNGPENNNSSRLLLMCTPGKEPGFQYTRTDNKGNFSFNIHIDESVKDLIIMPDSIDKNQKIILESSFSDRYVKQDLRPDTVTSTLTSLISRLSINNQVQKIYGVPAVGPPLSPVFLPVKPLRFYGKPDQELLLSDYINLPVMSEIFFELMPGVSLKKKKSAYEFAITEHIDDKLVVSSPCLLIDGVIIRDPSLIANLDPEVVEKIDVIKGKYLVGKYLFHGILNVITKSADFSVVPLPDYMMRLDYKVIDPVLSFLSPDYSLPLSDEDHIPDYRNTLYWNPSISFDREGKIKPGFWTSDNKADYEINIQGITQNGEIFDFKKVFRVR